MKVGQSEEPDDCWSLECGVAIIWEWFTWSTWGCGACGGGFAGMISWFVCVFMSEYICWSVFDLIPVLWCNKRIFLRIQILHWALNVNNTSISSRKQVISSSCDLRIASDDLFNTFNYNYKMLEKIIVIIKLIQVKKKKKLPLL